MTKYVLTQSTVAFSCPVAGFTFNHINYHTIKMEQNMNKKVSFFSYLLSLFLLKQNKRMNQYEDKYETHRSYR